MSRHLVKKEGITIAYGYDDMMPAPLGGYFFQVFNENLVSEENPEGVVVNEGMMRGISRNRMAELMTEYRISNRHHLTCLALDMPF